MRYKLYYTLMGNINYVISLVPVSRRWTDCKILPLHSVYLIESLLKAATTPFK